MHAFFSADSYLKGRKKNQQTETQFQYEHLMNTYLSFVLYVKSTKINEPVDQPASS